MNKNTPTIDTVIRIDRENTISVFTSKSEIGQGLYTIVAQMAAEELCVSLARIRVQHADTNHPLNGSYTAGSNATQTEGGAIRKAAADARHHLLTLAAQHLKTPIDQLTIEDGTIKSPAQNTQITYWELFGGHTFDHPITGIGTPKSPDQRTIVGQPTPRINFPDKVLGKGVFVHDLDMPNMAHGRIVRPPSYNAQLVALNDREIRTMPGVITIVQDGSFLGIIAEREEQAVNGANALRKCAQWQHGPPLPEQNALYTHLLTQPNEAFLIADGAPIDGPVPDIQTPKNATQTLNATYYKPYHMHGALGPSAALAHMQNNHLTVWSHTQGVYPLRGALAQALDMPETHVRVCQVEGSGCYGHNGADDVALDAALLARALPNRPILLKWMREDEHAWEPYGSCMAVKMQGSLDASKTIIDWNHDVYSHTHSGRPRAMTGASNLLAAWHRENPLLPPPARPGKGYHGGIHRNADPLYAFAQKRVVKHFVPNSPLRVSALRGLGATANVFAIESFIDELAHAAGEDPITFRLKHLQDDRAKEVIQTAANKAHWSSPSKKRNGHGQGIGFAQYRNEKCYVAVIIDVTVDITTGHIHLQRATIAADTGQAVNPDGVISQLEGGVIQTASWALKEEVTFDTHTITSRDWETYPTLTFPEIPPIETVLINRPDHPILGCGEATQGPTPAAIANAVFNATGIRLRQMPFTPARVLAEKK